MMRSFAAVVAGALLVVGCSSAPGTDGLRDSFAQQLSQNKFVSDFQRGGDELTFTGPRPDGTSATWRVHIDTAKVEAQSNDKQPFKGTIESSWFVNGEQVKITGGDSNLPLELTSNGLSQDCWAFWEPEGKRWSWE